MLLEEWSNQQDSKHQRLIHKALGLMVGEDGDYGEPVALEADIILVDEVSMMDIYLAGRLLAIFIYGWVAFCFSYGKEVIPMF